MEDFLTTHVPLANKNCPIIISSGEKICDHKFNMKLNKQSVGAIIYNLQNINNIRLKTSHLKDVSEMNYGNYNFKYQKNKIEFNIINTKHKYSNNNIYIRVIDIIKDQYIIPSFIEYNSTEKYDLMTINANGCIDICVYDYKNYFKCDIIIKKPVNITLLMSIINAII